MPFTPPNCSQTGGLDVKTETCLPISELCTDGLEAGKQYALSNEAGVTTPVEITPTDLTPVTDAIAENAAAIAAISDTDDQTASEVLMASGETVEKCVTDNKAAISALQALNPIVDTSVISGTQDILVTYLDGTTETLDLVEVGASTDAAGLTTFALNGTQYGPFDTGAHAIDTDTFVTTVDNGDGTTALTFPNGTTINVANSPDGNDFASWVDNGDGTITVTFADGTSQVIGTGAHTVDTDTFSTVAFNADGTVTETYANGATATFAVGPHTVDTDTTYAFLTNADGSFTVTDSNGTIYTSPAGTVDTDTFAAIAGQVITFANGDTLDVSALSDESTMQRLSDGRVLHTSDTGTTFAIPLDRTEGGLDDLAIPITQHGLSSGQVALGYNSNGIGAPTVALWNSAKSISYSVAPRSVVSTLYNSAFHGIQGIVGVRNRDGSMGHYNRVVPSVAVAVSENNGAFTSINLGGGNRFGEIRAIPDGEYEGQILRLNMGGLAVFQAILEGNFRGVVRDPLGGRIERQTGVTQIGVRPTEQVHATWHNGLWHVIVEHGTLSGTNYRENSDGTMTFWGTGTAANFPFAVANASYFTSGPSSAKTVNGFTNDDGGDWIVQGALADYTVF